MLGSKGGRCVGVTNLPLSCADCLEIREPQPPGTLRACNGITLPFYNTVVCSLFYYTKLPLLKAGTYSFFPQNNRTVFMSVVCEWLKLKVGLIDLTNLRTSPVEIKFYPLWNIMFQCLPSKAIVYLMHHALHYIECLFVFTTHRLDARLQTAGYPLMDKPSDDKLVVRKKEMMVKHTYQ